MKYVSRLIDSDNKTWNVDMLHSLFDEDTVNNITTIRIPMHGSNQIRWQPSSNGEFSVKSAYKAILNDTNIENDFIPNTLVNWKVFWKTKLPQSILHFLWKCISNCLSTNDRLDRYFHNFSTQCPHCNNFDESMQHLFIDCEFAKAVWSAVNVDFLHEIANVNVQEWIPNMFKLTYSQVAHTIQTNYSTWFRINIIHCDCNGGRCWQSKAIDPEQAEAFALMGAIIWAQKKGVRKLHLE
ncbi:uncharacterized protein LOC113352641 [Papaver somniferum]|uniref:uncharacterized protein LOC113352641 n=1 Tax=Papaver somniferum TaxID=3469 RepID=UPI000E6FBDC9|nr:uncharacterized protein LOC113352641 [Papaver somniferum]